jgi:hypothetical protein
MVLLDGIKSCPPEWEGRTLGKSPPSSFVTAKVLEPELFWAINLRDLVLYANMQACDVELSFGLRLKSLRKLYIISFVNLTIVQWSFHWFLSAPL